MSEDTKGNGEAKPQAQPAPDTIGIPPQAKYGIAVFEMDDGQIQEIPIIPPEADNVTYGQIQRLLYSALQNVEMSIFASKIKRELGIGQKPQPTKSGLVGSGGEPL